MSTMRLEINGTLSSSKRIKHIKARYFFISLDVLDALGKGATISHSGKQKLNTKSSTESELVGADDMLVKVLWRLYFIQSQGYTVDQNIMYQDNVVTMCLAINCTLSSSKRTKHIKARYFFIKDKVDLGGGWKLNTDQLRIFGRRSEQTKGRKTLPPRS